MGIYGLDLIGGGLSTPVDAICLRLSANIPGFVPLGPGPNDALEARQGWPCDQHR